MSAVPDLPPVRRLPAIHRLRPELFYGWYIVAGAFVLSFVSVGIGFYGQAVFLDGLIRENGWSRASVSGASTLYFITTGLVGMGVGRIVDRVGTRLPLFVGAFAMATALVWLGFIEEPYELYPVYLLLAASFSMSSAIPLSTLINQWFVRGRARAMSFSQTGVSVGGLFLLPLATALIAAEGIRTATQWLALGVLAVVLPITAWVVRERPREFGLAPDDDPRSAVDASHESSQGTWSARAVLRTGGFRLLALAFGAILICQTGLAVHHLHFLREHLDTSAAAFGAATLPIGSIFGRLVVGRIADRIDKRWVTSGLFATQALALAGLSLATHATALLVGSVLFGLTIGAVFMMQSLLVAEIFGLASFGTVLGLLSFLTSVGGGVGPLLVGILAEGSGGYSSAIRVLSVIGLSAALLILRVRRPAPDEAKA